MGYKKIIEPEKCPVCSARLRQCRDKNALVYKLVCIFCEFEYKLPRG